MYQGWVTHTHSHLGGECPHGCSYCYVKAMSKRFPNMKKMYSGELRLIEGSLDVDYGNGNSIFIDHLNDLFAHDVPYDFIFKILNHCRDYRHNDYVFQTKNPIRCLDWVYLLPDRSLLGTTIESNLHYPSVMGTVALPPIERADHIEKLKSIGWNTFITIEPILDFNLDDFATILIEAKPDFINIGADSKGYGLQEPSYEKIMELYNMLTEAGIEVRKKINLQRLEKNLLT